MKEVKLVLFPNSLEYRFCNPGWRHTRVATPLQELFEIASSADAERCQRLVLSGGSPLEHPGFIELVKRCRELGFKHLALETDGTGFVLGQRRKGADGFEERLIAVRLDCS